MSDSTTSPPNARIQSASKVAESTVLAVTWALCAVAIIFVVARISVRISFFRRLSGDDYFCLLALALLIGNSIVIQLMIPPMFDILKVGNGLETPSANFMANSSLYLKLQFANTILFWSVLWAVKGCFLAFFRKLTNQTKYPRIAWWVVVIITVLAYIGSIITYPVSCTSFVLGECQTPLNIQRSLISLRYSTAVDIITDLMIIAIPLWLVIGLKMSTSQKIGLCGVLGLGAIIVVFSVIRIIVTNTTGRQPEVSWLALWSSIESSVAVIVACLASFKVLLSGRTGSNSYGAAGYNYGGQDGNHSSARPNDSRGLRSNRHGDTKGSIRVANRDLTHRASVYEDGAEMQNLGSNRGNGVSNIVGGKKKDWDDDAESQQHLREEDIRVQTSFTVEHEGYSPVDHAR